MYEIISNRAQRISNFIKTLYFKIIYFVLYKFSRFIIFNICKNAVDIILFGFY